MMMMTTTTVVARGKGCRPLGRVARDRVWPSLSCLSSDMPPTFPRSESWFPTVHDSSTLLNSCSLSLCPIHPPGPPLFTASRHYRPLLMHTLFCSTKLYHRKRKRIFYSYPRAFATLQVKRYLGCSSIQLTHNLSPLPLRHRSNPPSPMSPITCPPPLLDCSPCQQATCYCVLVLN